MSAHEPLKLLWCAVCKLRTYGITKEEDDTVRVCPICRQRLRDLPAQQSKRKFPSPWSA